MAAAFRITSGGHEVRWVDKEQALKKHIVILFMSLVLVPGMAWAQAFPANEAGVTMGHWHLNTRDVEVNKKIFVAMGGTAIRAGRFEAVQFPGVTIHLHLDPGAAPPSGGSVGSVIDHVGFIVPNVQQSVTRWKAGGVPVLPVTNGRTDQVFIHTPDGLRIEIIEDPNQEIPILHHHVHWVVPESSILDLRAWYVNLFGGTPRIRQRHQTADIPGSNLTFSRAEAPAVTTKGRALDHIGFDVENLEAFCKKLEAVGIQLDRPYARDPHTGEASAFFYDPSGTYIELNERPNHHLGH
jgi:catechol 2,3-dioxygenase-like lactoylglutathione lyase family enzyme